MRLEDALRSMNQSIDLARNLAARGALKGYMHGYISGKLDTFAIEAGHRDAFSLQERLQAELEQLVAEQKEPA